MPEPHRNGACMIVRRASRPDTIFRAARSVGIRGKHGRISIFDPCGLTATPRSGERCENAGETPTVRSPPVEPVYGDAVDWNAALIARPASHGHDQLLQAWIGVSRLRDGALDTACPSAVGITSRWRRWRRPGSFCDGNSPAQDLSKTLPEHRRVRSCRPRHCPRWPSIWQCFATAGDHPVPAVRRAGTARALAEIHPSAPLRGARARGSRRPHAAAPDAGCSGPTAW